MSAPAHSQRSTLIAVAVIIVGGAVAGLLLGRGDAAPAAEPLSQTQVTTTQPARDAPPVAAPAPERPAVPALGAADLAALENESMAGPAASRIAAIGKLSKVPREQALPLLRRALLNGEPGVDRPAALQGLRELALAQGDADQRIRDAVREVIYHGDDEALAADAQETLDIIAESDTK